MVLLLPGGKACAFEVLAQQRVKGIVGTVPVQDFTRRDRLRHMTGHDITDGTPFHLEPSSMAFDHNVRRAP